MGPKVKPVPAVEVNGNTHVPESEEVLKDNENDNSNKDSISNNSLPLPVKHQLVLNDPTTSIPIVRNRENRILAFKVSECKQGSKFLLMLLYTHNSTQPPIIFNISNEERVTAFKNFYDDIPWDDVDNDTVYLFDFTKALSNTAFFEILELDKLPGVSAASSFDFYKSYCSSAEYVIRPKYSKNNTSPISQPYPDLIGMTEDEVEFCIRESDGNVTVRPWYQEWCNSDKPNVPGSYVSPTKASSNTSSSSSQFITPTAGDGKKRKLEF